ncbi:MAG: metalloprotease family protein [Candidatus Pacebacteria bacterium]|nr:metalloprotease family protein [Candidatus Paceibacterota bacterium]MDD5356863.1 metalloprotease family protein [Candidatus Paceibacterota bacterium]
MAWFICFLTFPGVILHEFAHKKFCDWFGVAVFKVSYFRLGNPVGQVIHAEPTKYRQVFWISSGPLILNTIIALVAGYLAFHGDTEMNLRIFLIWISFSAGLNAFPSDQDMDNIIDASRTPLRFMDLVTLGFVFRYASLLFVYPMKWVNNARYLWFLYAILLVTISFYL